ncbi:MAG: hypothetical protein LBR27_11470 [Bifidobacteriaceae bacterium]|jgi:hypothetical protein|nr:hypothetical protein [Bifidobacteriaceae bacterium]
MKWQGGLSQGESQNLSQNQAAPDPRPDTNAVLGAQAAQCIGRHWPGSQVEGATVTLGDTGIVIECSNANPGRMGTQLTVGLYLHVSGGPFGPDPAFASISGYAGTATQAIQEAACLWTCTFLDLLATANLITGRQVEWPVTTRPAQIMGRAYQVYSSHLDRAFSAGPSVGAGAGGPELTTKERLQAARQRVGGDGTMTTAVLASDTLPLHASDYALLLSTFAGLMPQQVTPEVKVHGGDWPPAWPPLNAIGQDPPGGGTLLRELAIAVPTEPGHLERHNLVRTLQWLAEFRTDPPQAAGWRGWRRHQGQLQPPLTDADIQAQGIDPATLPPDYHSFLTQVGWGAGPGYGLERPTASGNGWFKLAEAGDGIIWYLAPDGAVWADARPNSAGMAQCHKSFTAWYAGWLDNAVAGLRPWVHWEVTCASLGALAKVRELRANGQSIDVRLQLKDEAGRPLEPCHYCQASFAEIGLGDGVWPTLEAG